MFVYSAIISVANSQFITNSVDNDMGWTACSQFVILNTRLCISVVFITKVFFIYEKFYENCSIFLIFA